MQASTPSSSTAPTPSSSGPPFSSSKTTTRNPSVASPRPPELPEVAFHDGKTFTEAYAPKPPSLFTEEVEAPALRARPDVWERYIGQDLRGIEQDVVSRPEHYSAEHKETLARLRRGQETASRDRSDLLLTYMRTSAARKLERDVRKKKTEEEVLAEEAVTAFEDQGGFAKAISWNS
jgi:hypothetical protein